jgi:hypothetical protein
VKKNVIADLARKVEPVAMFFEVDIPRSCGARVSLAREVTRPNIRSSCFISLKSVSFAILARFFRD